jgi:hypothetical protein
MSKSEFIDLLILAIIAVIVLSFLPACAAEPEAPIQRYRAAYGFTP